MKFAKKTSGFLLSLSLAGLLFFGFTHVRALEDWMALRNYSVPAAVSGLAAQDAMAPLATHIFYVNHPDVQADAGAFRQACAIAEQTIVLGCYHSNQAGIQIYDVKDSRLNGVEQVTAAHEMLHAVYDRLSNKDRKTLDNMLLSFYNNGLVDQRIKDTIDSYKKTEPNDVVNEMHSIFGTEVASLPASLENYYKKYFVNRTTVVAFANSYEGEFTSRTDQIDADDAQLAASKVQIQTDEQNLTSQLQGLEADRAGVENSDSNAVISQYNARVSSYNAGVRHLQAEIASYNDLVDRRNALAAELRSLQGSLDTRLTTQPAQ